MYYKEMSIKKSSCLQLNDEMFLRQKYEQEKLTTTELGLLLGKSRAAVTDALRRANIPLRKAAPKSGGRNLLLNDYVWLNEKYWRDLLSVKAISLLVNTSVGSVLCAMKRFKIPRRTRNEATKLAHGKLSDNFSLATESSRSVFIGSLLGDSYLRRVNKNGYVSFEKINKIKQHIVYVAKKLFGESFSDRMFVKNVKAKVLENGEVRPAGKYFGFRTLFHQSLIDEYESWYPVVSKDRRKKCVPKNLRLNAEIVLHWFLDDGTSSWSKDGRYPRVVFCSHGFSKEDNEFLVYLFSLHGIKARVARRRSRKDRSWLSYICVLSESIIDFYKFIGPCPAELSDMAYKWKIPEKAVVPGFKFKKFADKYWLSDQYYNVFNRKQTALANFLGCHYTTVRYWLIKHGLDI